VNGKYLVPKRIEFLVTYLCNGYCRHCYAPKLTVGYPQHIDESLAVKIVDEVGHQYEVESVMTFGGEPMLFPEIVYSIHEKASNLGIPSRELITNGYWSREVEEIEDTAGNLAECGVNSIYFSVDAFHQEHIPINIVRDSIESSIEAGIEDVALNPCWLVSEDDDNQYNRETRRILEELRELPVRVSGGIVEPKGLALEYLREFLPPKVSLPKGCCSDIPFSESLDALSSISIEPDGRVAICDDFYLGDASETSVPHLISTFNPFKTPEMKAIIEDGMEGLVDLAKGRGVNPDPEGYYSICHMCTDLRKRMKQS